MTDTADLNLWVDNPCRTFFSPRRERFYHSPPEHITAPRKLWHENAEARIRYALANMLPDTRTVIEGVSVAYSSASSGMHMYYTIDAVRGKHDFAEAVSKIAEIAAAAEALEEGGNS